MGTCPQKLSRALIYDLTFMCEFDSVIVSLNIISDKLVYIIIGEFVIVVPKQTPGEHFEGLDMLTKLLEAKGKKPAPSSLIEVIGTFY
jgi:hypothetical protein